MRALLAAAAAAALLGGCYNRATELAELSRHHATAAGHVAVLECHNDGQWWYEFELEGKRRRGPVREPAGCAQRKLGDSVTVYYNPSAPEVHRAVAPAAAYQQEHGFHVPLWLWFGIGALALPLSAWVALKRSSKR
ncbi:MULTISPECIES: DUF3592 domain-containing protein [unclassified Duganella]|uniref:DUF3592 domain-containing protein n=1 Tax=unclassified Duganella TaxID=2636909 RepID=UPI0006F41F69|nr:MULTISPECIES: DUF3592 domain-containing protein [unclassified Duganella]KQV59824.1 hypothetical protein ASD07_23715 [Duganella sp. Root336D2]KRB87303.1 hypothetical protein ASE26_07920 [Duganella sp. Root198D2]